MSEENKCIASLLLQKHYRMQLLESPDGMRVVVHDLAENGIWVTAYQWFLPKGFSLQTSENGVLSYEKAFCFLRDGISGIRYMHLLPDRFPCIEDHITLKVSQFKNDPWLIDITLDRVEEKKKKCEGYLLTIYHQADALVRAYFISNTPPYLRGYHTGIDFREIKKGIEEAKKVGEGRWMEEFKLDDYGVIRLEDGFTTFNQRRTSTLHVKKATLHD